MEATDAPVSMVATRITREGPEEEVKKSLSRRRPQPKQLDERMRGRKEAAEQKVARKHMRAGKLAQLREQSEREEVFREKSRREEELREQSEREEVLQEKSKREEVLREQSKREEDVLWKREEVRREENESGVLEGLSGGGDKEPVTGGQVNQGASEQKRRESEEQDYLQVGQTASGVSDTGSLAGDEHFKSRYTTWLGASSKLFPARGGPAVLSGAIRCTKFPNCGLWYFVEEL
jgi:hypothetical protein